MEEQDSEDVDFCAVEQSEDEDAEELDVDLTSIVELSEEQDADTVD